MMIEELKQIIVEKILQTENAIIKDNKLIIYPPYNNPILQDLAEFAKDFYESFDQQWPGYLQLDLDDPYLGFSEYTICEFADLYHILCHCTFIGEDAETARRGAERLAHLRPQKKLRFYAYYRTAVLCGNRYAIDEVITLEELLQRGEVYTADIHVANLVIEGEANDEEYLTTLKKVASLEDLPIYEHEYEKYGVFTTKIKMRTNEFMLVLDE